MQITYEPTHDDYSQSANTLFHFMKNPEFLVEILQKKAIVPRYCKEDVEYLEIHSGDSAFREIYVLQKCFCDIPFHKLTDKFPVSGDRAEAGQAGEKVSTFLTHPDFYGEYAIAFSKSWGERKKLQPIHYLNEEAQYTKDFAALLERALSVGDVPEFCESDILNRLAFVKPLRGIMKRRIMQDVGGEVEVAFYKNFHDEQEWRYVPDREALTEAKKDIVIANPNICRMIERGFDINSGLAEEPYSRLWLNYSYEDVRYIIVPDVNARVEIISAIMGIADDRFNQEADVLMQKQILISKILVLQEIRKDW